MQREEMKKQHDACLRTLADKVEFVKSTINCDSDRDLTLAAFGPIQHTTLHGRKCHF